jgi:enoyl-CoA hydratase/carnithine racemase
VAGGLNKMSLVQFDVQNGIGIITLNRQEALNAINYEMFTVLQQYIKEWEEDPNIDVVVVKSNNKKAFCAGGDIKSLYKYRQDHPDQEAYAKFRQFFWDEYELNRIIHHYKKPYVSMINGIAMGGGLGISMHGTYRIVCEDVRIAMPETAIGFFPDVGSSYLFTQAPGQLGMFLGLTGWHMNTADALYSGIATHYMPREHFDTFLEALVKVNTQGCADEVIFELLDMFAGGEVPMLSDLQKHRITIDDCFSEKKLETIIERLRLNKNPWVFQILDMLEEMSPLSLKITHELFKIAPKKNFDFLSQLDFILSQNFVRSADFFEGIRAKLIDKDNDPKWQYKKIEDISDNAIAEFFKEV